MKSVHATYFHPAISHAWVSWVPLSVIGASLGRHWARSRDVRFIF